MRRGRDATAPALAARAVRPLVFLLVALFLVLPMLVYNLVTVDLSGWSAKIGDSTGMRGALTQAWEEGDASARPVPSSLEPCAALSVDEISTEPKIKEVRQRCFPSSTMAAKVPDMVHFVYLPVQMVPLLEGEAKPEEENFTLVHYAALQSVRKALKPTMMVLHYPATEPRSFWYTQCQRYLSLHRVVFPVLPTAKKSSLDVYQRRDIMQLLLALRALRKQGGVALTDFNTFVVRPMPALRRLPLVMGRSHTNTFGISTTMISATAQNKLIIYLESTLKQMLEDDDPRLQTTPLDRIVSDLLIDRIAEASNDPISYPGLVVTDSSVFGAVPPHKLTALLTSKVNEVPLSFHNSIAFHMPSSVALAKSIGSDKAAAELVRVQNRLIDFPALTGERTLFGAVLRYVTSTNRSAELDDILTN